MTNPKLKAILNQLKDSLKQLYHEQIESIILYGSQARGDATNDSDIDILVVLNSEINPYQEIDRTSDIIANLCLDYDVLISRHFISLERFNSQNTPFIYNVKKEGIIL